MKLINFDVMKKLSVLLLGALLLVSADIIPQQAYIEKYSDIAVSEMARTGVPASITLAQGILESDSGQSELAVNANNHFGIKCHNDWNGLTYRHDDETSQECFRVYTTPEESFSAHSDFLKNRTRYAALFKLDPKDYKAWASGLSYCGYATDPMYPEKLVRIIEEYKLYEFDEPALKEGQDSVAASVEGDESETVPECSGSAETAAGTADGEQSSAAAPAPKKRRFKTSELVVFTPERPVYYFDGAKCVIALPGETYESIAKEFDLFNSEVRRFNHARKGEAPVPQSFVFLERHRKIEE